MHAGIDYNVRTRTEEHILYMKVHRIIEFPDTTVTSVTVLTHLQRLSLLFRGGTRL